MQCISGGAVEGRIGCRGSGEKCFVNAALIGATTYRSFHYIITTAVIVSIKYLKNLNKFYLQLSFFLVAFYSPSTPHCQNSHSVLLLQNGKCDIQYQERINWSNYKLCILTCFPSYGQLVVFILVYLSLFLLLETSGK